MKQTLPLLFLVASVFCAPADCVDTLCPQDENKHWTITKIGDCDDPCTRKKNHDFDPELDKRKNIWWDNQEPVLRSIQWIKGLPLRPTHHTKCGNRDALNELGEGQKITVVAWALTARKGSDESANCDLKTAEDTDNHIVLVDPKLKHPTLAKNERHSVTAEFTPRVRVNGHHPNFNRNTLNVRIDPNWEKGSRDNPRGKLLVRVTGLLMFDSGHLFGVPLKRDTNWEVHPVLKMEFCPKGKTCHPDSDENWIDFDNI